MSPAIRKDTDLADILEVVISKTGNLELRYINAQHNTILTNPSASIYPYLPPRRRSPACCRHAKEVSV